MASVQRSQITFGKDGAGRDIAIVSVTVEFTPREVQENFRYAVNPILLKVIPDVTVIATHNGYSATSVQTIPQNQHVNTFVGTTREFIQPNGNNTVSVDVNILVDLVDLGGASVNAIIKVVPEVCEAWDASRAVSAPAPVVA